MPDAIEVQGGIEGRIGRCHGCRVVGGVIRRLRSCQFHIGRNESGQGRGDLTTLIYQGGQVGSEALRGRDIGICQGRRGGYRRKERCRRGTVNKIPIQLNGHQLGMYQ